MEVQEQTEEVAVDSEQGQGQGQGQSERRRRGAEHNGTSGNTVVLGPRDQLAGKLVIEGDLRVQGTVEGELHATGDVDIEHRATVRASIEGRNVSIRGEVHGDTNARERLSLAGSGTLNGNVRVQRLSIEDGATLNGTVTMEKGG
jgi:cytoskeletal protein CcmA (bactofilin family)